MIRTQKNKKKEPSTVLSSQKGIVFLVDNDPTYLSHLDRELKKLLPNIHSIHFESTDQAMLALDKDPLLIFLDHSLSNVVYNEDNMIQNFKKEKPNLEIIILSSSNDLKSISTSVSQGAIGHIVKGESSILDVRQSLAVILKKLRIKDETFEKKQLKKMVISVAVFIVLATITALYLTYK